MKAFIACLRSQLAERKFGPKRIGDLEARFAGKVDTHTQRGTSNPIAAAWREIFDELEEEAASRSRAAADAVRRLADANRIGGLAAEQKIPVSSWYGDGLFLPGELNTRSRAAKREGLKAGIALKGQIEADHRIGGSAQQTLFHTERAAIFHRLTEALNDFTKGAFGQQLGIRRQSHLGRALFGEGTNDAGANAVGRAFNAVNRENIERLRGYGIDIQFLEGRGLPARHSRVKMTQNRQGWIDHHLQEGVIDWDRTVFPSTGAPVPPNRRREFLETAFETKVSAGLTKVSPTNPAASRGAGLKIGAHRIIHYKGYDAWQGAHDAFGEGTVFDVMAHDIDQMAHALAMAQKFGRDPNAWLSTSKIVIAQRLQREHGDEAVRAFNDYNQRITEPMMTLAMRQNADVAENGLATATSTAGNLITSAWLGGVTLVAVPADFAQSALIRHLSGLRTLPALRDTVRILAQDSKQTMRQLAAYGHVVDEHVMGMRTQSRYLGGMGEGLAASRWAAGMTMRANGNARWTTSIRLTNAREFGVGFALQRNADTGFNDLPWRETAERYGITAADWEKFKRLQPVTVARGVEEMPPALALDAGDIELYNKFAGMVDAEGRRMVIDTTLESQVMLRGTTQPNNLVGVMLRSFSMFKMFPVTFLNVMTRSMSMAHSNRGKLGFMSAAIASMTVAGAFAVQMRELTKGRDARDMEDPAFWGQAFLTGGAGGFVADILFNGTTEYGRGIPHAVAGPLLTTFADATRLTLSDPFKWATAAEGHETVYTSKAGAAAVDFVSNLMPGQNMWYARPITESARLAVRGMVDPVGTERRERRRARRAERMGQGSWWEPGDLGPTRAPTIATLPEG